ncbi:glycosyltransferase family 2 protein [Priestia megaterium]|uniref:glycosyltransferase family 2 protein n=1 Tax=Priestia megaterium TaxID=1404 RepID=UPI00390CA98C
MDNKPLVYIILLNYNGYKDTLECIASLENICYENYEILIVDNNSKDNSEAIIKEAYPQYRFIQTQENLGFAGGNNIGIHYALENGAEYVCLLNNDTIVEPDFLTELVKTAKENEDAGIVGGIIHEYEEIDKIWYSGGYFSELKGKTIHEQRVCENSTKEVGFITGCLQLIHKDVIQKVGVLPEEYFIYYEDLDYCFQVKQAGYKLIVNNKAKIYHKCGGTASYVSPISVFYSNKNYYLFIRKFFRGNFKYLYLYTFYIIRTIIKLLIFRKDRKKAVLKAFKCNLNIKNQGS